MMQVGDVNLVTGILDLEVRVGTLEKLLDNLLSNNPTLRLPTRANIDAMRNQAKEDIKKKYPNMGIQ